MASARFKLASRFQLAAEHEMISFPTPNMGGYGPATTFLLKGGVGSL